MNKHLVSIILTYFNKRAFISKTLQTLKNQTYSNFEAIIIYDQEDLTDFNYIDDLINSDTSTDTSINTGVKKESITYGANDKLNCGGISQGQYYRNQKEEAYNKLVIATPIGKDIFNYASPNKFYALEKRIGFESFQQVKPLLIQYINAINQLG